MKKERTYDKRVVAAIAGTFVVLLIAVVVFGTQVFSSHSRYAQNISAVESTTQQVGGVTVTNYTPILADGIDWETLSADDREGTALYAVNTATEMALTNGTPSFNVLGMSAIDHQTLFLYTSEAEAVTLYSGDEYLQVPVQK